MSSQDLPSTRGRALGVFGGLTALIAVISIGVMVSSVVQMREEVRGLEKRRDKLQQTAVSITKKLAEQEKDLAAARSATKAEQERLLELQQTRRRELAVLEEVTSVPNVQVAEIKAIVESLQHALMSNSSGPSGRITMTPAMLESYALLLDRAPERAKTVLTDVFGDSPEVTIMTATWYLKAVRSTDSKVRRNEFGELLGDARVNLTKIIDDKTTTERGLLSARVLRGQILYELARLQLPSPDGQVLLQDAFADLDWGVTRGDRSFESFYYAVQAAGLLYSAYEAPEFPDYASTMAYACDKSHTRGIPHRINVCAERKWTLATVHLEGTESRVMACDAARLTNPDAYEKGHPNRVKLESAKKKRQEFCANGLRR